ncbi:Dirigent protein [Dillenia turbinata]|uniref:Dirigent protein n=1 Tax=Dillenia turbinata TaxID=194707 RepID=A0AAN8ZB46_9MAGN
MSHLHFCFHDIHSGRNQTSIRIAGPPKRLGTTLMCGEKLTEGHDLNSKDVGLTQGFYSLCTITTLMVLNVVFTDGKYNGSSIILVGRNPVFIYIREMPIVGGSGILRFVRRYVQAHTKRFSQNTGDAVVRVQRFFNNTCETYQKMASTLTYILLTFYLVFFPTFYITINGVFSEQFPASLATKRMEKMSHLHFYFHDILSGKNRTAIRIAGPPNSTMVTFGNTMMIDDLLTEGRDRNSKQVGRAQGLYSVASMSLQSDFSLLMVINFAFTEGKYNGSSISILGRNPVSNDVREMPIVGGSRLFRFARGYALAHTVWFDPNTGDAIVEYNVFVLHF